MTARFDETRDDIAMIIDDWLRDRVAGLPTPDRAVQAALVEINDTSPAERRSPGRRLGRIRGRGRADDRGKAVEHARTIRAVIGHASLARAASVALPGQARGIAAAAVAVALGTALLVALPGGRGPGGAEAVLPPVTGPARNGLIAFSRDGDIYVGDPVTGESEAIVVGHEMETSPKFSPDGTHLAFMRVHRPADAEDQEAAEDIIVVRVDGSDERVVKGPFVRGIFRHAFDWTPDSRSLVGAYWSGGSGPGVDLSLLDPSGVADARHLSDPAGTWPLRPPSGEVVASGGYDGVTIATVDGSDVRVIAELADLEAAHRRAGSGTTDLRYVAVSNTAWSPDGTKVAFDASVYPDDSVSHLFVVDADGTELRLLDDDGGVFAWSPDGSAIARHRFDRIEPGSTDWCPDDPYNDFCASSEWISLIDVESGAVRHLEATRFPFDDDGRGVGDWSWSPDGRSILLTRGESAARPLVVDIETDTTTELPWEADSMPSWQRVAAD